jgi:hypothetical protein
MRLFRCFVGNTIINIRVTECGSYGYFRHCNTENVTFLQNIYKLSYLLKNRKTYDLHSREIINKMQPCIRIYYSTVRWRLNMFRAAHRSSSGAVTLFSASDLHTHVVTGRSQVWVGKPCRSKHVERWTGVPTQTWLRPVITCVCKPEAANRVRAPDDERCAARNMLSLL